MTVITSRSEAFRSLVPSILEEIVAVSDPARVVLASFSEPAGRIDRNRRG